MSAHQTLTGCVSGIVLVLINRSIPLAVDFKTRHNATWSAGWWLRLIPACLMTHINNIKLVHFLFAIFFFFVVASMWAIKKALLCLVETQETYSALNEWPMLVYGCLNLLLMKPRAHTHLAFYIVPHPPTHTHVLWTAEHINIANHKNYTINSIMWDTKKNNTEFNRLIGQ